MFDIYDPSTYSEAPDALPRIYGERLLKDGSENEFITVKELARLILAEKESLQIRNPNACMTKQDIDNFLDKIYLTNSLAGRKIAKRKQELDLDKKQKENQLRNRIELIKWQLNNLDKITRKNKFNPKLESTYKYAKPDVITVIDNTPIYDFNTIFLDGNEYKNYLFETEYVQHIEEAWNYVIKTDNNKDKASFIIEKTERDWLWCSEIRMSDITIKGYNFSVAQKVMMENLNQQDKEKLTDIITAHFQNKEKRYRLAQEIFDNLAGKIDNMLFAGLCFAKDIEKEQEIMEDWYSGFDSVKSKEELEEVLDDEYLNLYPKLKLKIFKWMTNLLKL